MKSKRFYFLTLVAVFFLLGLRTFAQESDSNNHKAQNIIYKTTMSGMIDQNSHEHLKQALKLAQQNQASALLIVLDTPGGMMQSMDEIIITILNAPIPVITWVGPAGATCGSAGVFILYSSHISAMAPATNLGSATPLTMGPGGTGDDKDQQIPTNAGTSDSVNLKRKLFHHAIAQIKGLAEYHNRNSKFAVESITKARNITSREALKQGVIDIRANSIDDLLAQSNGQTVRMPNGSQKLVTNSVKIIEHDPNMFNRFLKTLSNPQLAYILFLIGMLGIYAEFNNPGSIYPGVIGAMCLLIGMYALHGLPLNYMATALIFLGIILFIMEMHIVSYGLLSIGGVIAIVLGSVLLFKDSQIGLPDLISIGVSALVITLVMSLIVYKAASSQRTHPYGGSSAMLNQFAQTRSLIDQNTGTVEYQGEIWQARSNSPIAAGDQVQIKSISEGLILEVSPMPEDQKKQIV